VAKAFCPGCRRSMEVDPNLEVGEWVNCPSCDADLEVASLKPLVLDWADEGLEDNGVSWTYLAGSKWSKWDKDGRRRNLTKAFREYDDVE
jgi:lysine biosynthesis protein LysW